MNERILELAKQCWEPRPYDPSWFNYENFAELIVLECARIAAQTPCPNFHEHLKQQLGHTWDMACVESAKDIRKHFGVEE
jgi:hypothetical protein